MTKNDKELIEPWLLYHGDRLGYENLHIVDDSTDKNILDLYNTYSHLNFHLHRDETGKRNLNNMKDYFTKIQNSIQDDAPIYIKMDVDEFLITFTEGKASSKQADIQQAINIESDKFWLPECRQAEFNYLKHRDSDVLDCTCFNYNKVWNKYKQSFRHTEQITLGGHNHGKGVPISNNQSKQLAIIHFHVKKFQDYIETAKTVCTSHGYINSDDTDQEIIDKLSKWREGRSAHKVTFLRNVLTNKIDPDQFYKDNKPLWRGGTGEDYHSFNFTELKEFKDSISRNIKKQLNPGQTSNYTEYDRYPEIFDDVLKITWSNSPSQILSFGCSTGDECRVLRELYFPESKIIGFDIDKEIIAKNIITNQHKNINYYSDINDITTKSDLIFAMSVLCIWPEDKHPDTFKDYNYNEFVSTVSVIDEQLNLNGYLCIYNTKYLFVETDIFKKKYKIVKPCQHIPFVHNYTKNNNRATKQLPYFLYRKINN